MVHTALRGVAREALARTARDGLSGEHYFHVSFRTGAPGVLLPNHLVAKYPDEMLIVLQHQFWDLDVREQYFSVTLSFDSKPQAVTIPFAALTSFSDPSIKFGLRFDPALVAPPDETAKTPAPLQDNILSFPNGRKGKKR
jgi:hypothetical protein